MNFKSCSIEQGTVHNTNDKGCVFNDNYNATNNTTRNVSASYKRDTVNSSLNNRTLMYALCLYYSTNTTHDTGITQ